MSASNGEHEPRAAATRRQTGRLRARPRRTCGLRDLPDAPVRFTAEGFRLRELLMNLPTETPPAAPRDVSER